MSQFGHGTFKQDVLEDIEHIMISHDISPVEAVSLVAEVLSYLASSSIFKDAALRKVKELAKEEARNELMAKLNS